MPPYAASFSKFDSQTTDDRNVIADWEPEQGAGSPRPKTKVARREAQVDDEVIAAPYRAPVAKMY